MTAPFHNDALDAPRLVARTYTLFPDTRGGHLEGCPCCVGDALSQDLGRGPREALPVELVSRYAFKAMTTWGDAALYRAMWPRIVECALSKEGQAWPGFADFVIAGKLEKADVGTWAVPERDTVDGTFALFVARAIAASEIYGSDLGTVLRQAARVIRDPAPLLQAMREGIAHGRDGLLGVLLQESEMLTLHGHFGTGNAELDAATQALLIEVAGSSSVLERFARENVPHAYLDNAERVVAALATRNAR